MTLLSYRFNLYFFPPCNLFVEETWLFAFLSVCILLLRSPWGYFSVSSISVISCKLVIVSSHLVKFKFQFWRAELPHKFKVHFSTCIGYSVQRVNFFQSQLTNMLGHFQLLVLLYFFKVSFHMSFPCLD